MSRILIIDNKKTDQELIKQYYNNVCCNFDTADSGEKAFYLIKRYKYDKIVVSNDLPDLNGIWIVQYLKNCLECNFVLTSYFNHDLLEKQAKRLNIGFLKKPIN